MRTHFFKVFSLSLLLSLFLSLCNSQPNTTFQVGIVLDASSPLGRTSMTSLSLAINDFYSFPVNYSTRLVLHVTESRGLVTDAAASALSLLKEVQLVDAIIGPRNSTGSDVVIETSNYLHPQTPYFVQTALSDAANIDAIAAIVKYFQWSQVVYIYEDSDYSNGIIPCLSDAFQQVNARVWYRSSIIPLSGKITWPGEPADAPNSGKKLKVGVPAKESFKQFLKVKRDPHTNATIIARTENIKYDNPNHKRFFLKAINTKLWLTCIALFILIGAALCKNVNFYQMIYKSCTTVWSKIRVIFRPKDDSQNVIPNPNVDSTVQEMTSENGAVFPNSDTTATAETAHQSDHQLQLDNIRVL